MAHEPATAGGRADTSSPNSVGARSAAGADAASSPRTRWLVAAGLVLAALNLRSAVSGLGPLLEEARGALHMSGAVAGAITSAPALCFAVFGSTAPRLARRHGPGAVMQAGLAAIAAGLALRPFAPGAPAFLALSVLALAGIAVGNVLMPVLVKRWFPDRVGTMTGLYSMALSLGTAGAAALTVPVTEAMGGDWRLGLGSWAVPAALALLVWLFVPRGPRSGGAAGAGAGPRVRIARSATAWSLGGFFGLQATAAYVIMGWLPQIYRDAGVPASTAGVLLAVTMGLGIPLSFALSRTAARLGHQGPLVAVLAACGLGGYAGLWLAPADGAWAWALLLGISNCAFPLALTMIGLRARTGAGVAQLSAFAQGTGYLLSVPGPLLVGALHQHTGGWRVPLALLAFLMLVQLTVGLVAGRNRCVEDDR